MVAVSNVLASCAMVTVRAIGADRFDVIDLLVGLQCDGSLLFVRTVMI